MVCHIFMNISLAKIEEFIKVRAQLRKVRPLPGAGAQVCYCLAALKEKPPPPVFHECEKVVCACGNSFTTGSTKPGTPYLRKFATIAHPFYTGQTKPDRPDGRTIEKFKKACQQSRRDQIEKSREKTPSCLSTQKAPFRV